MTLREILYEVMIKGYKQCEGSIDEHDCDILDTALASIRSVLSEEMPKEIDRRECGGATLQAGYFKAGYDKALSEAREVIERVTR